MLRMLGPVLGLAALAATPAGATVGPGFAEAGYSLVYDLVIPAASDDRSTPVPYAVNNAASIQPGSFDRIGYYLGLTKAAGVLQWVSVSMNQFASRADQIGVPTTASGETFQQAVTSMNVFSNVGGLLVGTGMQGGIQFWPSCYTGLNSTGVQNATGALDWGDTRTPTSNGLPCTYGAMQVADPAASQMLFSYNGWNLGAGNSDLGIANGIGSLNWTASHNANIYTAAELQIFVHQTQVPEPATLPVFAVALVALAWHRRKSEGPGGRPLTSPGGAEPSFS